MREVEPIGKDLEEYKSRGGLEVSTWSTKENCNPNLWNPTLESKTTLGWVT